MTDSETDKKISQLQLLEQGLQNFNMQKQQVQSKLVELETAMDELKKTDASYKIIGNIMVRVDKKNLLEELGRSKDNSSIRIKALEKQEDSMRAKAKRLQEEVLKSMEDKNE